MKKARLIYNPVAGKKVFAAKLDRIVEVFQAKGWQIVPYRTAATEGFSNITHLLKVEACDAVIVAGGDGTVHQAVNGILSGPTRPPLGIIPVGTANDFAAHINLPQDIDECCRVILQGNQTKVDVGWVSGTYFVNIASAGLLTEIPHKTDVGMKNVLGKLAYYLKGIEEIPNFRPIKVGFATEEMVYQQEVLLFLVTNGSTAGGFNYLAPKASIVDGKLDVVVVKPCHLGQWLSLLLKLRKGDHVNDPNVEYFQTNKLTITCSQEVITDLDGELGPIFPLEIRVKPRELTVFTPKKVLQTSRRTMIKGELF